MSHGLNIIALEEVYEPLKGSYEGLSAYITSTGIQVFITLNFPTDDEIKEFNIAPVELSATIVEDVPCLVLKCGVFRGWSDSPVYIKEDLSALTLPTEGNGYIVQMILLDSITGVVKGLHVFAISNELSAELYNIAQTIKCFNVEDERTIQKIGDLQNKYTSQQIAERCKTFFTLKGSEGPVEVKEF